MSALVRGLEAHVYVVGHRDGLIKVGYTAAPAARVQRHRDSGMTYGNPVVLEWVSGPHVRASENEQKLIAYCSERGKTAHGREWFTGVMFDSVRAFAETLPAVRASRDQVEQYERAGEATVDGFAQLLGLPRKSLSERNGVESVFQWAAYLDLGDLAVFFNEMRCAMEEPDALAELSRVFVKWRVQVIVNQRNDAAFDAVAQAEREAAS